MSNFVIRLYLFYSTSFDIIIHKQYERGDNMFCNKCGKETDVNSKFCNYCGAPTSYVVKNNSQSKNQAKKTTHSKTKKIYERPWFWVIVIIVILAVIANLTNDGSTNQVNTSNTVENSIQNTTVKETKKVETDEEKAKRLEEERIAKEKAEAAEKERKKKEEENFKNQSEVLTFEQLARNPDKIKGKKVKLTGEVIQVLQGTSSVDLRINITKEDYGYYTDTIYALYIPKDGEDKILEGDNITIWGTAQGDYSYTSVLGSKVTLPFINVNYIQINSK